MVLVFALLAIPVFTWGESNDNSSQILQTGGTNPAQGLHEDGIAVKKTVTPSPLENYFEITLEVSTSSRLEQFCTTDVVLVMDVSRSMHDNFVENTEMTRLEMAKENAVAFVDAFLGLDSEIGGVRRLALVAYDTEAVTTIPWTDHATYQQNGNASTLNAVIRNLQARKSVSEGNTASDYNKRFTNIEGGLQLAENLLADSIAETRYVILLTDGFPTTYIQGDRTGTEKIAGYDTLMGSYTGENRYNLDGFFSNPRISGSEAATIPCLGGTNYSDKGAERAEKVALALKNQGVEIFSVGISEPKDFSKFIDQYNNNPSPWTCTIDCYTGDGKVNGEYVIGSAGGNRATSPLGDTNQEMTDFQRWLGGTQAENKMLTGAARGIGSGYQEHYLDGSDEAAMENARERIIQAIIETYQARCAELWQVEDPMGPNIEFLGFYDKDAALAERLDGTGTTGGENTADFSSEGERISWELIRSGYEEVTTADGSLGYRYRLRYRVRLENEADGFLPNTSTETNGETNLSYSVYENKVLSKERILPFPRPSVQGYWGTLTFQKNDGNGNGLPGAEFLLQHESDCSICGGRVKIENQNVQSGFNGAVILSKIPSGHQYSLSETRPPDGYLAPDQTWQVSVAYGNTILRNGDQIIDRISNISIVTPTPQPTITPIPSATPIPTATPTPTQMPQPTLTPLPTATVTPGVTPLTTPTATPLVQIPQTGDGSRLRLLTSLLFLSLLAGVWLYLIDERQ